MLSDGAQLLISKEMIMKKSRVWFLYFNLIMLITLSGCNEDLITQNTPPPQMIKN